MTTRYNVTYPIPNKKTRKPAAYADNLLWDELGSGIEFEVVDVSVTTTNIDKYETIDILVDVADSSAPTYLFPSAETWDMVE